MAADDPGRALSLDEAHVDLLRRLAPQVLGVLVRRHGDFTRAEDAVQEALVAAVERWPRDGVPEHPAGWLHTVAQRRYVDQVRAEAARARRERAVLDTAPATRLSRRRPTPTTPPATTCWSCSCSAATRL
ncbi:hypothetical protein Jiend_43230 [Micromonospora endophytica]|uniref:sigma factor n=1 Tax=Micromonospora endophytica TaxID=515350 RepID=UPI001C3293A6|nr:hypothetical protein Jiend_43230 [Micromonospora endophytica]